jgi:hypothetical protein
MNNVAVKEVYLLILTTLIIKTNSVEQSEFGKLIDLLAQIVECHLI